MQKTDFQKLTWTAFLGCLLFAPACPASPVKHPSKEALREAALRREIITDRAIIHNLNVLLINLTGRLRELQAASHNPETDNPGNDSLTTIQELPDHSHHPISPAVSKLADTALEVQNYLVLGYLCKDRYNQKRSYERLTDETANLPRVYGKRELYTMRPASSSAQFTFAAREWLSSYRRLIQNPLFLSHYAPSSPLFTDAESDGTPIRDMADKMTDYEPINDDVCGEALSGFGTVALLREEVNNFNTLAHAINDMGSDRTNAEILNDDFQNVIEWDTKGYRQDRNEEITELRHDIVSGETLAVSISESITQNPLYQSLYSSGGGHCFEGKLLDDQPADSPVSRLCYIYSRTPAVYEDAPGFGGSGQ